MRGLFLVLTLFFSSANAQVRVQPFKGFPINTSAKVVCELAKIFPKVELLPSVELPQKAYYSPRNRYKADVLLGFLKKSGYITLGLTQKDISTSAHGVSDWGIMGLSLCPGEASVVSTYRLSKENQFEQLIKVCVHELGHAEGLPHCKNPTCLMADAKGKNPTNQETGFCDSCKKYLQSKGWKL